MTRRPQATVVPGFDNTHWRTASLGHEFRVQSSSGHELMAVRAEQTGVHIVRRERNGRRAPNPSGDEQWSCICLPSRMSAWSPNVAGPWVPQPRSDWDEIIKRTMANELVRQRKVRRRTPRVGAACEMMR